MSALPAAASAHAPRAVAVCVVGVAVALVVQTALLPAVGLSAAVPFGYATVVLLAVVLGSSAGALTGFAAGLLLDLNSVGTLGVGALLGCLVGAAAGRLHPDRWWFSGVPTASALVIAAAGAFTVVNAWLGQIPLVFGQGWLWLILGGVASGTLLLPTRTWLRAVVR